MDSRRAFLDIWVADLTVRAAYQIGKAPLLPLFALSLGASDAYLGFIVSVSTLTGMLLKPAVGLLSDRWGRRGWLILGTAIFAGVPFLYRLISTPEQLLVIRLIHGCATAIYGPVTLAYVADQSEANRGERIGWFSLARSGGYVLGPALAGWLLVVWDPVAVFTLIGFISMAAFIPILRIPASEPQSVGNRTPLGSFIREALRTAAGSTALWVAGGLEGASYILLYAVKTFLPIFALASGVNAGVVGSLFAVQELVNIILKPAGGRLADRLGPLLTICTGMLLLGSGTVLLAVARGTISLGLVAVLLGSGQALIFPATVSWLAAGGAAQADGGALGLLGALRNAGKIAGPVLAGFLIARLDYQLTFLGLGSVLLAGTFGLLLFHEGFISLKRKKGGLLRRIAFFIQTVIK